MGLTPKKFERGRSLQLETSLCYRRKIVERGEIAAFLIGKSNPFGVD